MDGCRPQLANGDHRYAASIHARPSQKERDTSVEGVSSGVASATPARDRAPCVAPTPPLWRLTWLAVVSGGLTGNSRAPSRRACSRSGRKRERSVEKWCELECSGVLCREVGTSGDLEEA